MALLSRRGGREFKARLLLRERFRVRATSLRIRQRRRRVLDSNSNTTSHSFSLLLRSGFFSFVESQRMPSGMPVITRLRPSLFVIERRVQIVILVITIIAAVIINIVIIPGIVSRVRSASVAR